MANCLWTVLFERGHLFQGEVQKEQKLLFAADADSPVLFLKAWGVDLPPVPACPVY